MKWNFGLRAGSFLWRVSRIDDQPVPVSLTNEGSDTSSTALCAAFFYLSRYPACYDKLVSEIRATFPSASDIRFGSKLAQCHYLRACIDEAMRMTPPVGAILWREVCTGGARIDNRFIPAGYDVGCSIYTINHNKDYFPDPYIFKPERWSLSAENSIETLEKARLAFQPFSLGPRGCAGKTMAYMEISDTLARTLWYMDFRRAKGPLGLIGEGVRGSCNGRNRVKEFQVKDHISSSHDGPYLEFRCRVGPSKELFSDEVESCR